MSAIIDNITERLYAECNNGGWWEGELSSSALSTAVAVFALGQVDRDKHRDTIERGLNWLATNVNHDGGWGDTPDSASNMATTALCWSAFSIDEPDATRSAQTINNAGNWIKKRAGSLEPADIASAISACYGEDKTFSAPILSMCALAGRLGDEKTAWRLVPQLPYELAMMPRSLLGLLRLSVVSYALPALISIGVLRHSRNPDRFAVGFMARTLCRRRVLTMLEKLQPANGGFLEATPLTSFVVMSLAGGGEINHPALEKGAKFLLNSMRTDGSWPIDTNLATWVTTLSINALNAGGKEDVRLAGEKRSWLLSQQSFQRNIFTNAAPGGWGWTDLPGSVPDADDTAGVLIALRRLGPVDDAVLAAGRRGIKWLLDIQNSDGGVPTFCRGWGKLPFDRSCPDITAHAMRALDEWRDEVPALRSRIDFFISDATGYLASVQQFDGTWLPLWFGNQNTADTGNPVYGTAQVVISLRKLTSGTSTDIDALAITGANWLASSQNDDGGWGGNKGAPSTIEETALAVIALGGTEHEPAVKRGLNWLDAATNGGRSFPAAPIGLYFASLWYSEKIYPLALALQAFIAETASHRKPAAK